MDVEREPATELFSNTCVLSPLEITGSALKPPLKWAGGKRWLVPQLRTLWQRHQHRRLVEPFCGGLAVSLGLLPARALLADINPHLISFYLWLQRGLQVDTPMANDRELYYAHRAAFNALIDSGISNTKEAAELFYYLNRTGYNGLCRFNRSQGFFNVPFGRYQTIRYVHDFSAYCELLSQWDFQSVSFSELTLEPDDFVYADPPYDVPFRNYAREGFSWDDQVNLAERLALHPGPVVLSNQATPRIIALYERLGYSLRYLSGPRMINRTGDRTPAKEVLAVRGF